MLLFLLEWLGLLAVSKIVKNEIEPLWGIRLLFFIKNKIKLNKKNLKIKNAQIWITLTDQETNVYLNILKDWGKMWSLE